MKMIPFEFTAQLGVNVAIYGPVGITVFHDTNVTLNGHNVNGTIEEWLPKVEAHNAACLGVEPVAEKKEADNG